MANQQNKYKLIHAKYRYRLNHLILIPPPTHTHGFSTRRVVLKHTLRTLVVGRRSCLSHMFQSRCVSLNFFYTVCVVCVCMFAFFGLCVSISPARATLISLRVRLISILVVVRRSCLSHMCQRSWCESAFLLCSLYVVCVCSAFSD